MPDLSNDVSKGWWLTSPEPEIARQVIVMDYYVTLRKDIIIIILTNMLKKVIRKKQMRDYNLSGNVQGELEGSTAEIEQNKHSASVGAVDKNFHVSATTLQCHVNTESRIGAGRPTGKGQAT